MRILNVTQSYAPFYEFGGPPAKVEALAAGLAARGHQVTVLSVDWGYEERRRPDVNKPTDRRLSFGWTNEANGVQSIYLPSWLRYRALTWSPAAKNYCRAHLSHFDIVHIFGLYDVLGPLVAAQCRKRQIPYVVEPIGMFVPIVRNVLLKRLYHAVWGSSMLAGAAAVIATSEQEVQELASGGISRPRVFLRRNGVQAPAALPLRGAFRKKHGVPGDAWLVLFLGRLSSKKSPDLLLEAFAQLPPQIDGRQMVLVFAGPDESGMQARLQRLAAARQLEGRVFFSGAAFGEEKWNAYCDADVFVLPSQNENFGNTAAEAAICGTPVVVTQHCGIAPLLAGTAGIVVAHETGEVARAVKEVLCNDALRCRLAQGGKNAASLLGWHEPVSQMENLYARLAGTSPAG